MKGTGLLLIFAFFALLVNGQNSSLQKFYVGTFTSEGADGVYLCGFNEETGELSLLKTFKGLDNPAFLRISPNQKYIYVATRPSDVIEPSGGFVAAYKINDDGSVKFLNKQVSGGVEPCHVDVSADGKYVATANYVKGTVALFPVNNDGSLQPASSVIENKGSGPDKSRQLGPHAHSVKFSPWGNEVFSADLGTDQLNIMHMENGKLVQRGQEFMKLEPGAGPRHFEFSKKGRVVFVISELNSTITSFEMNGNNWVKKQVISTLPNDFKGESYCADIHISNDGRFLYGSNRGHNSIAVFRVDDKQNLSTVGFVPVEGNWPRNFSLTPDGNFMLVANQRSGNITVFKVDRNSGALKFTGKEIKLPSPVCIEFLKL
ncbi:MAG: lactonase family protein [Draconibacterium sp.]